MQCTKLVVKLQTAAETTYSPTQSGISLLYLTNLGNLIMVNLNQTSCSLFAILLTCVRLSIKGEWGVEWILTVKFCLPDPVGQCVACCQNIFWGWDPAPVHTSENLRSRPIPRRLWSTMCCLCSLFKLSAKLPGLSRSLDVHPVQQNELCVFCRCL